MVTKGTLDKVRSRIERLRKDSLDTATAANKIVYDGVQRIADNELKSLNQTYKEAIKSLKQARNTGSRRDVVSKQIDTLQDTANRVIASAREAIGIVSETRDELTRLMRKSNSGTKVSKTDVEKPTERARKAVKKASTTARKAAKKATKKTTARARATTKAAGKASTRKTAGKKAARKTTRAAGKRAASARKAPQSRAGAATSRAKGAARKTSPAAPTTTPPASDTPSQGS